MAILSNNCIFVFHPSYLIFPKFNRHLKMNTCRCKFRFSNHHLPKSRVHLPNTNSRIIHIWFSCLLSFKPPKTNTIVIYVNIGWLIYEHMRKRKCLVCFIHLWAEIHKQCCLKSFTKMIFHEPAILTFYSLLTSCDIDVLVNCLFTI